MCETGSGERVIGAKLAADEEVATSVPGVRPLDGQIARRAARHVGEAPD